MIRTQGTWLLLCLMLLGRAGEAGQRIGSPAADGSSTAQAEPLDLPFAFDGPPAPVPPEVIARDAASGRATVRAVRLTAPLRIDGRLDEAVYTSVRSMSDFIQQDPQEGARASEKTEAWLFFDRDRVYVSFRCWESHPERLVATEMRRDNPTVFTGNDNIAFILDTFYDRRNSDFFTINPIGGRSDGQVTNDRQYNADWNPIWDLEVGRFEGGWTVEVAIPFKSLRYRPGRAQIWGFNVRRINRSKNEMSYLTRVPASRGIAAIMQGSLAATVVGLEAPAGSRNLELKPYAISDLTSDLAAAPRISNQLGGDVGVDLKYGLTQNLTADFTYNTDFAQVEADEQQINLTRFSLFFPEKREFFLENQGTFAFGGAGTSAGAGGDTPTLFYSRRIGLDQGRAVPIAGGGRLTGRVGRFNVGVLNIQSDDDAVSGSSATNFSVVRVKRDFLRRSSIGALVTGRSMERAGAGRTKRTASTGRSLSSTTWPSIPTGRGRARTDSRTTTPAIARNSITQAIATVSSWSVSWWGTTSTRKWDLSAATTCARASVDVPLQPAAAVDQVGAQVLVDRGRWPTSRMAPAGWKRGSGMGSSASSSRTATSSQWPTRAHTSSCRGRSASRPASRFPSAATIMTTCGRCSRRPAADDVWQPVGGVRHVLQPGRKDGRWASAEAA